MFYSGDCSPIFNPIDWKNDKIDGMLSEVDNFQSSTKVMITAKRVKKLQYFHVTYLAWHSAQMKASDSRSSSPLAAFACFSQKTLPQPSQ